MLPAAEDKCRTGQRGHEPRPPAAPFPNREEGDRPDQEKRRGHQGQRGTDTADDVVHEMKRHPELERQAQPEETPHTCLAAPSLVRCPS